MGVTMAATTTTTTAEGRGENSSTLSLLLLFSALAQRDGNGNAAGSGGGGNGVLLNALGAIDSGSTLKELLATAATSSSTLSSQNMRSCAGTNTVNEGGGRGR